MKGLKSVPSLRNPFIPSINRIPVQTKAPESQKVLNAETVVNAIATFMRMPIVLIGAPQGANLISLKKY
jgi:hypothetical protein